MPSQIDIVAQPVMLGGTNRVTIEVIIDHNRPRVTEQNTYPVAHTAKSGVSTEMSCKMVGHARRRTNTCRRGRCRMQRTNGNGGQSCCQSIPGY